MKCFTQKKHDNYLDNIILPNKQYELDNYDITPEENNLGAIEKSKEIRKKYMSQLHTNGYSNLKEEDI